MKTKSKIPALRFKGFTDAWEERKLAEFTTSFSGGTPSAGNSSYYKGDIPFIRSGEINSDKTELFLTEDGLKNSSAKMVSVGDILYALYGATSGEVGISQINGAINQAILAIRPIGGYSSHFIMQWLRLQKQKIIDKYLQGGQGNLSGSIIKNLILNVPNFEEQQKIGSFFKQLDDTIALHQRKCDQTKELKKTMLQKMFPKKGERIPEIRFPEFTDEWEEKKLGEMLTERNVQQVPQEDAPLVSFTVENGVTPKTDRYDREFLVRTGDKKYKYTTFDDDDIVYNPANLKFGAIARNKFGDAVFSPIYVTLVADKEKVLPIFIERIVTNGNFIQESLRYQEGTVYERMSVKVPDFLSMKISIPSLPEQEAIGAYFQTLDQDIAQIEKKLADLKELKKALLRQLFV